MSRHRLRALLLLVPVVVLGWSLVAWVRHVLAEGPLAVIAHRGAPATRGAPEGTLAAFRAAVDAGADWLELDVRTTADGALVVLHDATVDRTTDGTGPVSARTLADVRALDAGGGARIPTVEEIVSLAKEAGIPILHPVVRAGDPRAGPGACTRRAHVLARRLVWRLDVSSPLAGVTHVCPMGEIVLLSPDLIRGAHEAGLTVFAWWDRLEGTLTNRVLEAYGVDGIMVDDLGSVAAR